VNKFQQMGAVVMFEEVFERGDSYAFGNGWIEHKVQVVRNPLAHEPILETIRAGPTATRAPYVWTTREGEKFDDANYA